MTHFMGFFLAFFGIVWDIYICMCIYIYMYVYIYSAISILGDITGNIMGFGFSPHGLVDSKTPSSEAPNLTKLRSSSGQFTNCGVW